MRQKYVFPVALVLALGALPAHAQPTPAASAQTLAQAEARARKLAQAAPVFRSPSGEPQPERFKPAFNLEAGDFSLLSDEAFLRKAQKGANSSGVVAEYLLGLEKDAKRDRNAARQHLEYAAREGLVRAQADVAYQRAIAWRNLRTAQSVQGRPAPPEAQYSKLRDELKALVRTHSAHAAWRFAQLALVELDTSGRPLSEYPDRKDFLAALQNAAVAGYAPAQLALAGMLFDAAKKNPADKATLRTAHDLLDKAAAQGDSRAIYAKTKMPRPAGLDE